jgi:peptide deformylase
MILPIYAYGQPVLKQEGDMIDPLTYPEFEVLVKNMFDTMYAAKGVGLAAPQIGLKIKLFIMDTMPYMEEGKDFTGIKKVFVNATLVEEGGEEWPFEEGCLSIPDLRADVERKATIKIDYLDESGQPHIEEFNGLNARVIQHEYDHTLGRLFIDRLKPLKKRMVQRRLDAIKKGQIEAEYKLKFYRSKA